LNTKIRIITTTAFHIAPLNESALLLSYGNVIDIAVNDKIIDLYKALAAAPFPGFIEAVPAYASIAVFYDAFFIKQQQPQLKNVYEFVKEQVTAYAAQAMGAGQGATAPLVNIPVHYNGADLQYIAEQRRLTIEEIIGLHTSIVYHVYMIGFLPGFAYMGPVNEKIAVPRKETPRLNVAAGSVGIAGVQTGIYPVDSPGGWQLIGTTPLRMFNKEKKEPCLLKAGDRVQFTAITKNEFDQLNEY